MASRLAQRRRTPGNLHLPPPSMAVQATRGHAVTNSFHSQQGTASPALGDVHFDDGWIGSNQGTQNIDQIAGVSSPTADAANHIGSPRILPVHGGTIAPHSTNLRENLINTPLTAPVAIPPAPRVSSPYYSPSQVFPPSAANKSYFPSYLSQSPQKQQRTTVHKLSSNHYRQSQTQHHHQFAEQTQPKTPRSPSTHGFLFSSTNTTNNTGHSPSFSRSHKSPMLSVEHPVSALSNSPMTISDPNMTSSLSGKLRPKSSVTSSAAKGYHVGLAQQQRAFALQQREIMQTAIRSTAGKPISPRLLPLGSPGPVTPLTLEDNPAGYLFVTSSQLLSAPQALQLQQHHLDKLAAAAAEAAEEENHDQL